MKHALHSFVLFSIACALVACGGSVAPGDPGTGGQTTSTGGTNDSGSGGVEIGTTEVGTIPVDGGVEAGAICGETHDTLSIDVTMPSGDEYKCWSFTDAGGTPPETIYAQILDATVDTCPPNADCIESRATIHVVAKGLDLSDIPKSSYVTIQVRIRPMSWACMQSIVIESAAEWGGLANPVDTGGHTYLVAADSTLETTSTSLTVGTLPQGCLPGVKTCGGPGMPADDYVLRFTTPTTHVDAHMGEEPPGPIPITPGDGVFVRNLRSYQDGACDAYWNYAFWAVFKGL